MFLAATADDEINLLSASIASAVGAGRTIARVHHSAYFEGHGLDYARHLGIDHLVCPEHTTAVEIARTLRNPGALALEQFARGRIEMQRLPVTDRAPAIGRPLAQVALKQAARENVTGKPLTPFLLDRLAEITGGVLSGTSVVKVAGASGGAGELAEFATESAEVTR